MDRKKKKMKMESLDFDWAARGVGGDSQAVARWVRWGGGGLVWPMLPAEETRPERREKSEDSDNFTTASQREEEKK